MKKHILLPSVVALALLLGACGAGGSYESSAGADYAPADGATGEALADYDSGDPYHFSESYLVIDENTTRLVEDSSVLSFSLKVDTAAYSNVARYIENGSLPPADAVRTEELINYFRYEADMDLFEGPFGLYTEIGPSPFDHEKHMALVRVTTQELDKNQLPGSNLIFLIDTSGSMNSHDKLPLLKQSMGMLVETLDEDDTVSIVTYAGSSAVVLDGANGGDRSRIMDAINSLEAGGSTAGGEGIVTAYHLAEQNFLAGGNNRVILASDGDFNVGISSVEELQELISEKRDTGVYLSVLGFGTGNIRDDIMETLATHGNGNYSYIGNLSTAQKVLVEELASNLFVVAEDVKAQVEFNPENVRSYRLIGYENRRMSNRDFDDDTKDAGEVGAGTDVIMLFELELQNDSGLKYTQAAEPAPGSGTYGNELFDVRIRYKEPGGSESKLITRPVTFESVTRQGSTDFQFACAVASFGDLLRDSQYAEDITVEQILSLAESGLGRDQSGYRAEFLELLQQYRRIA